MTDPQPEIEVAERLRLRAFTEACLIVEEGLAGVRDVDTGLALGAGMAPGPFAAADAAGLDHVLARLEALGTEPPVLLRRLVAQGRLGRAAGQGFYAYPNPDEGWADRAVQLETRGAIAVAWLANPPANSISGAVVDDLEAAWAALEGAGVASLVIASANPALFCAGADIRAFQRMEREDCEALLTRVHALFDGFARSRITTIAAVNGLALGGGCELAMACDVRLAGTAATFGQPEIDLGLIPGFGGTQRLPRLVGEAKALEMNLSGKPITAEDAWQHGLANRVVADHELFDAAVGWARLLAGKAPVATGLIKDVRGGASLEDGLRDERRAFLAAFGTADATEGIGAFLGKRDPEWTGR